MSTGKEGPPALAYVTLSSPQADRLREFYSQLTSLAVSFQGGAYAVIGEGTTPPVRLAFQQMDGEPVAAAPLDQLRAVNRTS